MRARCAGRGPGGARDRGQVDCQVFLHDGERAAFAKRFDRMGMGLGWTETDDNSAANTTRNAIVNTILTE